jgi:predicted lipid-binding transport protein (Tim44 family)
MDGLLPAQGFDTLRTPSWIEFPFFNAESRRETHQGGANESTEESETSKEQQAPESKPKQARGFFGFNHFSSAQNGFARPAPD